MRARAVLAAAAALVPVLLIASVAGILVQRQSLTSSTTMVAREHATAVAGRIADGASPDVATQAGGGEDLVQVVRGSHVVAASAPLTGADPLAGSAQGASTVRSGVVPGESDRFVVVTASVPGDSAVYVAVARSLESVDNAAASTTWLLVAGSALVVLMVGALTWVLTGRALRPVDDMRRKAAQITQANLSTRLPSPDTGDEVERLATTLNSLLDRLERAVLTQRQFVADASHELRSPMASLRVILETAHLEECPAAVSGYEGGYETDALRELSRLEDLVADLLLLARSEARPRRRAPVDLTAEVATVAALPGRLPVEVRARGHAWVDGDRYALSRVVRNLLDNAQRHARSQVDVVIETYEGPDDYSGGVRLMVGDDGTGIPESDRERVFGRFVRLDESRTRDDGGSGLGLAIVRQIVVDHGGAVTVEDGAPGAVFIVDLPCTKARRTDAQPLAQTSGTRPEWRT
jgi:signal transduction histidine kinase